MIQRMVGPDRITANSLADDVGVAQTTLSRWLREASGEEKRQRKEEKVKKVKSVPQPRELRPMRPDDLPPAEKFRLVKEAAELRDDELGAFLRRHGLHQAQLEEWQRKVEEAALSRGCRLAQVKTWDFQARGFYERLDYHIVGRQKDFPPGQTLFWLRKELIENDA